MGFKKAILVLLLLIILTMGAASAVDTNTTSDNLAANEDTNLELSENDNFEEKLGIESSNPILDAGNSTGKLADLENAMSLTKDNHKEDKIYDDILSVQNDLNVLNTNYGTYSGLATEIGSGGNIELNCDYYTYDSGSTIEITVDNSVIDGKGAVIDMAGSSSMRAFKVTASDVTIKNLTIKNANYNGNGGAIYFSNSSTVTNCNFTNNKADYGGAVYFGDEGTVTNCNFINNIAFGDYGKGGAVYFSNSSTVTNCNFTDNKAWYAGAVYFDDNGEVTNCNFADHKADGAGAVYFGGSGSVENCNFTNNMAGGGYENAYGGAINMISGTVTNCNFTNNQATDNGGAVYIGSNGTVTNCNFTNNSAYESGGAVYFYNAGRVSNCNFTNNSAYESGGAVYIRSNGTVTNCNFTNNKAIEYNGRGGAVYIMSNGTVTNCNFTNNQATDNGGAICFDSTGNDNVSNCNFINCSAELGKAIYASTNTIVSNCNFETQGSESLDELVVGGIIYNCTINGNNGKTEPNMTVTVEDITYGENATFTVILPSDATGILNITVGNMAFTADVSDEPIIAEFSGLDIGTYIANITYTGDLKYLPANANETFTVSTKGNKTFTDLKNLIDSASSGDTIELDDDYTNDGSITADGITIAKYLTINGKGHTLNANQLSRIFYIIGNSVHLENITFTNGKNIDLGGAICGYDTAVYLLNCTFINNSANQQGGVLYGDGMHISVSNSSFINNTAEYGGAILIDSGYGDILNSLFIENTADENGGAIDLSATMPLNINIADCSFEKCLAKNGGAIYIDSESYTLPIDRCDFINCSATQNGGSTYYICQDGQIRYSRFINSSATSGKAIYAGATATISNSEFEDLTAKKLSDVIYGGIITNCTLNENLPKNVDLDISIVSNITGSCQIGDSIEFTVTVTNAGPSDATGTYVSITYSELQIMNSYDTLNGSVGAGNSSEEMFWTIGNLGAGETATLTITSKTLQTGNSSLSVTVVSSLNDVNTSNNAASSIISILAKASTLTIDTNINGSSVTLMFTIPEDAMGTISITVDGTNYNKTPVGGKSSLNLNLAAGTYPVSATYSGDVKYMPTTNNTLFIVNTIAGNTFTDLKSIIDAASPGDTIKLEDNYTNDGSITADGIAISKAITIDGNGHTLNANGKSRTFVINTSGVTIKNTIFTNGHQDNTGSAIYWSDCTVNVLNCTFINNAANYDGGAIGWTSSPNSSVSNCTFINNTAQMGGGAIYSSWTNNWSISNCVFINSYARYDGGAIITWGDNNGLICNCTFEDNSAGRDGETVFWYNGNGNIDNSKFININKHGGKVIYSTNTNVIISNSNFEDETVENLNEIIYGGTVINCTLNSPSTKIDPSMTITTTDIHYGENATINVSISNDATGSIIITVDNNEYELQIIDGKATLTINNLETGTYTAYATYTGDLKYLPANASSTFTVSSKANKTFTDLKNLIDAASPKDTIKLEDDYTNDGSITADGITISKAITIDGKGHTLDAKGSSRIFKINAENVTLKNIIFKNGHGNNGGAIQWMNTKGVADNCTFISCSAENGGSVYWNGENGMINTSTFDHSTATSNGGAIYWKFRKTGTLKSNHQYLTVTLQKRKVERFTEEQSMMTAHSKTTHTHR